MGFLRLQTKVKFKAHCSIHKVQCSNLKGQRLTGVSRYLLPFPWGRGKGEGLLLLPLFLCFVTFFRTLQIQHMLFWLAINAKLACKRRPFDLQLTPFKHPKDALLKSS